MDEGGDGEDRGEYGRGRHGDADRPRHRGDRREAGREAGAVQPTRRRRSAVSKQTKRFMSYTCTGLVI